MSRSNKNTYIFKDFHGFPPSDGDLFRRAIGSYWLKQPIFSNYGDTETINTLVQAEIQTDEAPIVQVSKVDTFQLIPRKILVEEIDSYPYFKTTQKIEIFSQKDRFLNEVKYFTDYFVPIISSSIGKTFSDFSFDVENPLSEIQTRFIEDSKATSVYKRTDFEYNYYSKIYETKVQAGISSENVLPNLYNFLSYANSDGVDNKIFRALTAGGQIDEALLKTFSDKPQSETNIDYFSYFDGFGNAQEDANLDEVASYMKNIIFDVDSNEILKTGDEYKAFFPMYTELQFTTDSANEVTEILQDSKLSKSLFSYLSNAPQEETNNSTYFVEELPMFRAYEQTFIPDNEMGQRRTSTSALGDNVNVSLIDVSKWIEGVFSGVVPEKNEDAIYFEDNIGTRKMSNLEKTLYLIIFSGKLKSFIKRHNRSFIDISGGQKCHSETICYKVLKYAGGDDPIQTIWLPNTNEIDVIKYVDTQVKFDKEYTYEVFACQMIIGTEYEYVGYEVPPEYFGTDGKQTQQLNFSGNPAGEALTLEQLQGLLAIAQEDLTEALRLIDEANQEEAAARTALTFTGLTNAEKERNSNIIVNAQNKRTNAEAARDDANNRIARYESQILMASIRTMEVDGNLEEGNQSSSKMNDILKGIGSFIDMSDDYVLRTDYAKRLFTAPEERRAVNTDENFKADIYLQSTPSVKIAEVPFFSSVGKIIDDPPIFPNVDMIPYRGVKDKILINLSPTVGEYKLQPVVFNNAEQLIVNDIRKTKDLFPDEPITFTTDDYVSRYEIYRMETPPEKIEDFSQNLRNVLTVSASGRGVSSASFVDDIEPNKEYYYTFRTIDIHGKVSNPSAIYRLIMVENSGAVYPLLEVYEIKQEKPKEASKSLKKLLNIKPRLSQTIINQALSSLGNGASVKDVTNIVLGVEEKSLFGKRFKIRLTSKHTGKQIDLNVRFNVEVNKN